AFITLRDASRKVGLRRFEGAGLPATLSQFEVGDVLLNPAILISRVSQLLFGGPGLLLKPCVLALMVDRQGGNYQSDHSDRGECCEGLGQRGIPADPLFALLKPRGRPGSDWLLAQKPSQIIAEFARRGVASASVLFDRLLHDRFELDGDGGAQLPRRNRVV